MLSTSFDPQQTYLKGSRSKWGKGFLLRQKENHKKKKKSKGRYLAIKDDSYIKIITVKENCTDKNRINIF